MDEYRLEVQIGNDGDVISLAVDGRAMSPKGSLMSGSDDDDDD